MKIIKDLKCDVHHANPLATVQWSYSDDNGQTWSVVTPNFAFAKINGSKLRLNDQKFYKTFYKCVASNTLGKDIFTWQVLNEGLTFFKFIFMCYSLFQKTL